MKNYIRNVFILSLTVFFLSLTGCENFLNSKGLKDEIQQIIIDANAEKCNVTVFAYSSQGTLTAEKGNAYSVGTSNLKLGFSENSGWQFVEYQVYNSSSQKIGCSEQDPIYIKNPFSSETEFSINDSCNNYKIEVICKSRPTVESVSPIKINSGVNADSTIEIIFSESVSKDSFVFSQQEFESFGTYAKAIRENIEDDSSDIIGINLAGMRFFKNIRILDSEGKGIENHYNAPKLSENGKTLIITSDKNNLFDFSSVNIKDVNVIVSSEVGYDYTLQNNEPVKVTSGNEDYNYNFRITYTTTDKAKVIFNNKNEDGEITGTLNYTGTQEFNVGQSFKVEFIPSEDFSFITWDVSDSENLIVRENNNELMITVIGAVSEVIVQPVCQKKDTASFTVQTNIGNVLPVGNVNVKVGDIVTLTYTGPTDYYFPGWVVINTAIDEVLSREQINQFFECEDWTKNSIDVRIKKVSHNFKILANSYIRPYVFSHEPLNSEDGVTRDSNIKINFNTEIDERSLYFTDEEEFYIKRQDPTVNFLSDGKGKYGYKLANGEIFYKNISIINNYTGENLTKYYKKPYLLENKRTVIIPANKVLVETDGVKKLDDSLLPPKGIEVFVQLGTDYGFYSGDNLVPINLGPNLSWIYSLNDDIDLKLPTIDSFSASAVNNTESYDAYNNKTCPSDRATWQSCYLKDNKLLINATLKDESKNLSEVYLTYTRVQDENCWDETTKETKKYALNFRKDGTNFYVENQEIDLKSITGQDGTYELSLFGMDDSGNEGVSDKFYVRIDKTSPRLLTTRDYKIFKKYKTIKFSLTIPGNNDKQKDYESHDLDRIEFYVDGDCKRNVISSDKAVINDFIFTPIMAGKYKIIAYDIFDNKTETSEFDYNLDIPYGSVIYSDQWTLDWWNYDGCEYTDYAVNNVIAVGHVGYNMESETKNFSIADKNIKIFSTSADDDATKCNYSTASRERLDAENNKFVSIKATYGINYSVPDSSNYQTIFGDEALVIKNQDFMAEKLKFVIWDRYYWLCEGGGRYWNDWYHEWLDHNRTVHLGGLIRNSADQQVKNYIQLSENSLIATLPYRFISNFTFTE